MCCLTPYKFVNWFLYYTQLIQQTKLTLHVFSAFSQRGERELEWRWMTHACSLSFHSHGLISILIFLNTWYVLNQMFIFETFHIFEYLVTRPSKQDQSWIYLNYFLFYIFQLSFIKHKNVSVFHKKYFNFWTNFKKFIWIFLKN